MGEDYKNVPNKELNFSFVAIMKNEANTLPRLFESIKPLLEIGLDFVILDTGSSDGSAELARSLGARVIEVGPKFIEEISEEVADAINKQFVVGDEPPIIRAGDRLFNFAEARNHVVSFAKNDFVFTLDCDEAYSKFDIDYIVNLINSGHTQFEYEFVYAHDEFGRPAFQFVQSKAYDRRVSKWTGKVHEVLQRYSGESKVAYIPEAFIKLEHWQEPGKEHRGNYLTGLGLDCYLNPNNDRNSHYLARELMYTGRFNSAIKEFSRHIEFNGWPAEKAQSMIYMGDCYGSLGNLNEQLSWYHKAFACDPTRREALIKAATVYKNNKNWWTAMVYAKASLEIPQNSYYGNDVAMYRHVPHEILYECYGWLGVIDKAQEALWQCLQYSPYNLKFLRDTQFYFEYPSSMVDGWMTFEEQTYLYNLAKSFNGGKIAEVGSWKGRSSQALLTGNKDGLVCCVDTWRGSTCDFDDTKWLAQEEDIFAQFKANTAKFSNLKIVQKESVEGAKEFPDKYFDAVFIDAGHDYKNVTADIKAWLPKVKDGGILCGHDYMPNTWQEVIEAVDDMLGKPDEIHGTIWVKHIDRSKEKKIEIPKTIYTCWFNESGEIPPHIQKCINSQRNVEGYKHVLLTLKDVDSTDPYVYQCLNSPHIKEKWTKLKDYIQMGTLYQQGGWFLDADVEILPGKNFDAYASNEFVAGIEFNGTIPNSIIMGSAVLGARPRCHILYEALSTVVSKFRGDDNLCYESSLDILTPLCLKYPDTAKLLPSDVFYPYNHQTGTTNITDNTICIHKFYKSWILPSIDIIIPHVKNTREEGLNKCLESIKNSDYPSNLINVIINEDDDTVPNKLAKSVRESSSEYIIYAADDIEFYPSTIRTAVEYALRENKALISFNEGELLPDAGNICTHFLIKRAFIPYLGGEIFDTRLHHVGVDNLLWHRASRLNQAAYCEAAKIEHNHFSKNRNLYDSVYAEGWKNILSDRQKLNELLI